MGSRDLGPTSMSTAFRHGYTHAAGHVDRACVRLAVGRCRVGVWQHPDDGSSHTRQLFPASGSDPNGRPHSICTSCTCCLSCLHAAGLVRQEKRYKGRARQSPPFGADVCCVGTFGEIPAGTGPQHRHRCSRHDRRRRQALAAHVLNGLTDRLSGDVNGYQQIRESEIAPSIRRVAAPAGGFYGRHRPLRKRPGWPTSNRSPA